MVDSGGLENRCPGDGTGGSNPSLSANNAVYQHVSLSLGNISPKSISRTFLFDLIFPDIHWLLITDLTSTLRIGVPLTLCGMAMTDLLTHPCLIGYYVTLFSTDSGG